MANLAKSVSTMAAAVGRMTATAREVEIERNREQIRDIVALWRERHDHATVLAKATKLADAIMSDMLAGADEALGYAMLDEMQALGL